MAQPEALQRILKGEDFFLHDFTFNLFKRCVEKPPKVLVCIDGFANTNQVIAKRKFPIDILAERTEFSDIGRILCCT